VVVQSLLKEIEQEAHRLNGEKIETIYFGGGTPSLLEAEELNSLMFQLRRHYNISSGAEITLEANPDDIQAGLLNNWAKTGINRLSIGVQSFREEDLTWMNRAHTAKEATAAITLAKNAGFNNLTIDLIYGTPGLSDEAWRENVNKAIDLEVPHLSCYALTVEPKTVLDHLVKTNRMADTDPEQQARQFLLLMDWLTEAGYEHYEISNFARPGMRSRHNSAYWKGIPYLGIGPGAHSYDGLHRRWNVSNNALYVTGLEQGLSVSEEETLTPENRLNEYVMTSLRTIEGIDLSRIIEAYGEEHLKILISKAEPYRDRQQLSITERNIRLTNQGKLYADGIASDFFSGK
jgi:oxygen-independent coproporphyrinogen-3 oxidase